jgi:hypothetical protein
MRTLYWLLLGVMSANLFVLSLKIQDINTRQDELEDRLSTVQKICTWTT